ncbi:MAG TPA: polymorphic toxin-type HINT domain-containing protein [Micromonosporaceae bacterium]|nr:polymorphic toxin-type HINT domain-containing protein [Micromonosporaceae bacterium]
MRASLGFRLLSYVLTLILVTTACFAVPRAASAAPAAAPVAKPGAGPVDRPLPREATPNHGRPVGELAAPVPPTVKADGAPRAVSEAERSSRQRVLRALAPDPARSASDVLVRPGFLLGDTSLVAYFNGEVNQGDATSWARWWATVTDVESQQEQRSATLGQADVSTCYTPRSLCRSFGAADGWTLDPARKYTVTITVVQPDGSEQISTPSAPAQPRTTVVPPSVPSAQAVGCGCATVLGPTLTPQALRGATVNTGTGAYLRTERDFVMPSYGIPFNAGRYYSSANPTVGAFGAGWSWSYDIAVVAAADGAARVRAEDGSEAVYTRGADGSYTRPPGIRSKLSKLDTGWELTTPDQRKLRFDAQGRLVSIKNLRGHGVTLAYAGTGLLDTITDASGRVVRFEFRADLRLLFKMTLPDGRFIQFDYEGGRLKKVQDARGYTTAYDYDPAGRLDRIVDARGNSAIRNTYHPTTGRVTEQFDAEGGRTAFEWDAGRQVAKTTDADGVWVLDGYRDNVLLYSQNAGSDAVNHRYDGKLRKNLVVDPKGNQEETTHDDEGNPTARKAPEPFGFSEVNVFDDRNNLTSHKDGRNNTWSYEFNTQNEMTVRRNPKQKSGYRYTYDDKGQVKTRTDARDKVTTYEYDAHGNRTAEITPTGRRTEMEYDLAGRMTAVVDPRGTGPNSANRAAYRTRVDYDKQDRVTDVWQPGKSASTHTEYDEVGNATVQRDAASNASRMTYDKNSRLTTVKDPVGNLTEMVYTPAGRRSAVFDGERNKTSWTYDVAGRPATETSPRGNADPARAELYTTRFHYDYNGNLIQADRPYENTGVRVKVDTAFDELDRPTEQRDQFNVATRVGYDNAGNVVSMTNERGEKLEHTFDEANRRTGSSGVGVEQPAGIDYDDAGNPTRQVTPTGGVITWQYDDDGRPVAITEPRGNVAGANPADYTTRYAYDPAGNLETVTDPLGNVTKTGYDALNRAVAVTDARGNTTRLKYDLANRLERVIGPDAPDDKATVYVYKANGLLDTRTDPMGHSSRVEYDKAGRMTASTDPLGRRRDYVYDPDSNLIEEITARQTEPGGQPRPDPNREPRTISYTYDNLSRPTGKKLGVDGPTYTFGYDAKNRLVSAADPAGLQEREYDDLGRLTEVKRGSEVFTYDYDASDRLKERTYPDGTKVTAEFDEGDRVRALTSAKGGTSARYAFDYDVSDNLKKITYPAATGVVSDRDYDRAGRLTKVNNHRGDQVLSAFELTPDKVGNPSRITSIHGQAGQPTITETTAYDYDKANRLTAACYGAQTCAGAAAERIDYTYDLVGNRKTQKKTAPGDNTTTTYTYDAADQLTREVSTGSRSSERTFDYDLEGNQTRAGADTYTYSLDHKMTSATLGGRTTNYTYDAAGNRIAATSGSGATAVSQTWTWDVNAGMPLLAQESETRNGGTSTRDFLYDPAGQPLAMLLPTAGGGQAAHSYLHDWIGGVAGVVGPDGALEWAYNYDPFGVARGAGLTDGGRKLRDDAPANPMQFAGGYHDTSQGDRYQLRARNYDPGTGRFDGTDPVSPGADTPTISSYAYAHNRPSVLKDPTGLYPELGEGMGSTYAKYYTDQYNTLHNAGQTPDEEKETANPDWENAKKVVDEAEGFIKQIGDEIVNLILDLVGFNDAKKCVTEGDVVACVSTALQAVPWGKLFKAAKVMVKAIGVGRRLVESYGRLKAARNALANIPRYIKKASQTADEAAASKKYQAAAAQAASGAKASGAAAKASTKKAAAGAKKQQQKRRADNDGGESCQIAQGRGLNSFTAGTLVVMGDKTSRPIEQVQAGDTVQATNPQTGLTEPQQVTAKVEGTGDKALVDLTLVGAGAGGGGPPSVVTATDGHKFFVPGRGWVEAGKLQVDDVLRDTEGRAVVVTAVAHRSEHTTVHNLTVNDVETYYVEAGGTQVLVHNCGLADLANMRKELGSPSGEDVVLARLDVGGQRFYGVSGHGQSYPRPAGVTPQSMTHAEGDAFGQAGRAGVSGGHGTLYIDGLKPCRYCRSSLGGFAKSLDLDTLTVVGPNGYLGQYLRGGGYRTLRENF